VIALYFTGFRLGVKVTHTGYGYTRTYRLGWLNVAYFNRKAARCALRAPKQAKVIWRNVDDGS
jgi:hypothetical protein